MPTTYALVICILILSVGLLMYFLAMQFTESMMNKKISASSIFNNFGQKIWLTTGLGIYFILLYFSAVFLASYLTSYFGPQNLFNFAYKHPVASIYLGLFAFAFVTTSIYLVRMLIKYLYLKKHRN